jgi:hypothetical protein
MRLWKQIRESIEFHISQPGADFSSPWDPYDGSTSVFSGRMALMPDVGGALVAFYDPIKSTVHTPAYKAPATASKCTPHRSTR